MKSIFDKCKESARKSVKAKINQALLRILKKKQQSHFLNKTSVEGGTRPCCWFRVVAVKMFPFLKKTRNRLPLKNSKNLQTSCNFPRETRHRCFPVNLQNFKEQLFYRIPQGDYGFLTLIQNYEDSKTCCER